MCMFSKMTDLPIWVHAGATAGAIGVLKFATVKVNVSYAASNHPVDHATGQLAFSAEKIEGFYAHMIAEGTLDAYARSQMMDFGIVGAVMVLSVLLGSLAARLGGPGSYGWRAGFVATVAGVSGAMLDAVENLLSFVMLRRPDAISELMAWAYSAAAALKFTYLALALLALICAVLIGLVEKFAAAYRPR